jgi:hypothetical protein
VGTQKSVVVLAGQLANGTVLDKENPGKTGGSWLVKPTDGVTQCHKPSPIESIEVFFKNKNGFATL